MKEIFTSKNIYYSVIVPAYNEEEYIEDTLDSIFQAMEEITGQKGEVIVVDNNSTDKTAELALSKGARLIFEKENQGFVLEARFGGILVLSLDDFGWSSGYFVGFLGLPDRASRVSTAFFFSTSI